MKQLMLCLGVLIHPTAAKRELPPVMEDNIIYGQWEEVEHIGGIKTYVRWIYYTDGTKTRERKGEMVAGCSQGKAVGTITSTSVTKKWMTGVSENYVLAQSDNNEWYTYTLYSIPWPFQKRDLVSFNEKKADPKGRYTTITITGRAGYIPQKPGIERLSNYRAVWTITELKPQQVHIVFFAHSDTPPLFPRYIQDPVIEKMFRNNLMRLKNLLDE